MKFNKVYVVIFIAVYLLSQYKTYFYKAKHSAVRIQNSKDSWKNNLI